MAVQKGCTAIFFDLRKGRYRFIEIIELMKRGAKAQWPIKKKIWIVEDEIGVQELSRDIQLIEGYIHGFQARRFNVIVYA